MSAIDKEFLYTFKIKGAEYRVVSIDEVMELLFILNKLKLAPKPVNMYVRNRTQLKRLVFDLCYKHRNNLLLFKEIRQLFS